MTPFEKAREVYRLEPCARTFEEDLILHLRKGYMISTEEVFLMFREVHIQWMSGEDIVDPSKHPRESWKDGYPEGRCWHVYLAAGNPALFERHFPYPLPWVSGERNNRLRFYRYRKTAEKLSQHGFRRPAL